MHQQSRKQYRDEGCYQLYAVFARQIRFKCHDMGINAYSQTRTLFLAYLIVHIEQKGIQVATAIGPFWHLKLARFQGLFTSVHFIVLPSLAVFSLFLCLFCVFLFILRLYRGITTHH
jgi:hypothetical protein